MGSCENLTSVDEPSCNSVFEQHSSLEFMEEPVSEQRMCLKTRFDVLDANVSGSTKLDGRLGLSIDDTTHCVSCGDAGDTGIGNKDGLIDEFQNVVGVSLEKAIDDECGVSRVCFIESREEIGVCSSPGRCLDLSQDGNNIYVSSAYVTEAVVGDRDGSVSKCDNVSGSGLEKLVDESQSKVDSEAVVGDRDGPASECDNVSGSVLEKLVDEEQGVCLDGSQSEVDVCGNGLCVEKGGFQGEDLESFKYPKLPLGEVPSNCSPRNCDRRDKQKDDQGFNRSSIEETIEVMGVETNALAEVKLGNDNQTLSSDAYEMPLKSIPVGGLTRNCVQQHGQKGDNILSCLPGEEGVMIKKSDELAELEKVPCDLIMPFGSFGIPLTGSPRNCVQHGNQKDGRTVSCSSSEGDMEGKEVKTDALDGIEKVNCFQISPSQFCEMPPELLPFTGSPNNSVQQEDQKNDNTAGCTSSEGDMECIEEKTDALSGKMKVTCDQMLPSQCCEMDSEAISLVDSPTDCVQLGNQENNKNGGSLSSKSAKEVIEDKMGTCGQILPSQGCSMTPELIPKTDSLRNCTQQNEQKSNECICVPSLEEEGKNYASVGIEIDICGHMLSFQECEIRSESTLVTEKQLIVEAKRDIVHGLENDGGHPRSPLEHTEPRMEFASATDLSFSCIQKKEQQGIESLAEGKANLSAAVEANMWKANLAAAVEANTCNCISASQDGETPFKVFYEDDLMRTCEGHKDPVDHESIGHLAVGTVEQKDNTDTCILALPMRSCQSSLESLRIADSLSNCSQQNDQGNNNSVDGLSAESATEAVEEKSDVTTDIKVEICSQLSPIEENEKEHSSRVIEKPISLQSCQPSAVDENGSCKSLNIAGLSQKDGFGAISSSGAAVDGFGQIDHEVKDDVGRNCFSETKYPNRVSLSSRRSSRISRSSQKTQTKRAARNCRTKAKIQHSHGSIDIILNIARRKRSCLSKPARSSIWGLLGSVTQIFGESGMSSFNLSQNQGSQKARGDHRSQKRNKIQASGSSLTPSKKWNVSTRCLRLKVKVGKEICQSTLNVVVPKVADTMGSNDIVGGDDISESYPTKNSEFPILAHEDEDIFGEEGTQRQFQCLDSNPEEVVKHPGDSILDVHFTSQELKATVITDNAAGDVADGNSAHKGVGILGGASENNYVDPGTSPDSEVINTAPDSEVGTRSKEGSHKVVLTSSEIFAAPGNVTSSRRGKKKTNLLFAGNCSLHDDSPVAASKVKPPKKRGGRQKLEDGSHSSDSLVAFPVNYASSNSSSGKEFCCELLPSSRDSEPGIIEEAMVPSVKCKGSELSKSLKSGGRKKGRSKVSNSAKSRRRKASTQRGNQRKSVNKNEFKEKGVLAAKRRDEGVLELVEEKTEVRPQIDDIGKTDSGNNSMSVDVSNAEITSGGEPEHYCPPESAWVRCDDCYKWRRIPVSVADLIDENCRWVCKDNMDTTFADCSIPQEKTNADINAELGLSDYEEEDGLINYNTSGKGLDFQSTPGSSFRRIDSNVFLHRSRKTQTIDEVMVCHCKPPLDGRLGCRDECLNRMLNIECVQGTCPCGDLCSNQQYQKRKYAKMQWRPCGKKGYGLESLEDIPTGKFIIEYVGEVLDMQAYEARQKEYAANGHKHFYFMTLNGSEVIDACAKGNLGRFINHSCDPNCRTEKWMVNGEICIGLFAMRDIKEGEELTFDYNYVRVFGAAAKKCHCGSPQCRGYIGGDPLNTEIIYQGDSDEEYPEPLMLEDGETGDGFKTMSRTSPFYGDRTQISEAIAEDTNKMDDSATAVGQLEISGNVNDSKSQSIPVIPQLHHSLEREDSKGKCPPLQSLETSLVVENESSIPVSSVQQKETMNKTSSVIPQVETSLPALISGNLFTDGSDAGRKSKSDIVEDNQSLPKSHPRIKTSRKSGSIKKGKVDGSPLSGNKVKSIASKSQVFFIKPKKIMEGSSNGRFEAVQEKLNELLDAEGGISKRKDAPKGYLKLLLLTAASGGSGNGESIQSNRDLSMILDALLKTKSRVVLMDIINKNGLQMLHNMIKQYRRDFKKIPILRKLLKVLEYLAVREILTRNHITAGPPCPGMESFRGSILSLTEHDDKQVHQIARSFRDRWIPKPFRKHSYKDRDDSGMDIHRVANCNRLPMLHNHRRDESLRPSEAIDCVMQSLVAKTSVDTAANEAGSSPGAGGCQTNGPKVRKRKSRWDQPAETNLDSIKHKKLMLESRVLPSREDINCPDHIHNHCNKDEAVSYHCNKDEAVSSEDGGQITQEDVPPGFSSPFNPPLVSSDSSSTTDLSQQNVSQLRCAFDVAIAHPQGKFNSRLPVSYGIPLHILQQFGSSQAETVDSWVIAPSMPFHPFPPLPPFPRDKKDTPPASAVSCKTIGGPAEEWQQDSNHAPRCCPDEDNPSMTGANQSDADIPGTDAQHTVKRMRGSSNDLGKRYFRQQKRKGPPWLWRRNELRSSYCSQDVSCRVDKPVSSFIQRPPQQNHH